MNTRQKDIIIIGVLILIGFGLFLTAKGLSSGIGSGVQALFNAIAQDIKYLAVGAGIAFLSLLLPPPLDIIGLLLAVSVTFILFFADRAATQAAQNGNPDTTL